MQLDVGTVRVWRCVGVGFSRRVLMQGIVGAKEGEGVDIIRCHWRRASRWRDGGEGLGWATGEFFGVLMGMVVGRVGESFV